MLTKLSPSAKKHSLVLSCILLGTGLATSSVHGASGPKTPFSIGLGLINSLSEYKSVSDDDDGSAVLYFNYDGEDFHLEGDKVYYDVLESGLWAISLLAESNGTGFEADDRKVFKGMAEREDSIDIGAQLTLNLGYGQLLMSATKDVDDTHDSEVVKLMYQHPFLIGNWTLIPKVGATHLDDKFVDYYYGVRSSETRSDRAAYKGKAATKAYFGISSIYQISPRFKLTTDLVAEKLPDEIKNSPLTDTNSFIPRAFIGVSYQF